jgi:hypothetical protein
LVPLDLSSPFSLCGRQAFFSRALVADALTTLLISRDKGGVLQGFFKNQLKKR